MGILVLFHENWENLFMFILLHMGLELYTNSYILNRHPATAVYMPPQVLSIDRYVTYLN